MRIIFLLPGYPSEPIGGYRVVYEYANHFTLRGHEVYVVHPQKMRQYVYDGSLNKLIRRKAGIIRNILFRPRIKWQEIDSRVHMLYVPELTPIYITNGDVIFATAWQTAEYAMEYPPGKGRKFYLIQDYETWSGPQEKVDATWRAPLQKVVIARWLYEKGLEIGVPPQQMKHIPNGIDLKKFRLINAIEDRSKRVTMLYHTDKRKGSEDGIKALMLAKEACPNLEAVLFGVSIRPTSLPDWIDYRRNPPQNILVKDIYNGSSIYLCSSLIEGWGLPGAEAMACGCALVSTDTGGVRDYAIDRKTALISMAHNPEALAANIILLLKDEPFRLKLAKAGYENIQNFSWERATDALEEFINIKC